MEIGAALARIELFAYDPTVSATFYESTFGLKAHVRGDDLICVAPGRELHLSRGAAGQLRRAAFRFGSVGSFEAQRKALIGRGLKMEDTTASSFSVRDPEGRLIQFLAPAGEEPVVNGMLQARLQHFGVRSPAAAALADFYVEQLGFIMSDRVLDAAGDLTAAFLRTDAEHHSMAIFRAPEVRFDHFSCEVAGWNELREWADHMALVGVDLAWGIGRHGPGNDTFLMVKDPDGNLAEVSSDLEVCTPDRPTGLWEHRPQTLNQWGVAIMRS